MSELLRLSFALALFVGGVLACEASPAPAGPAPVRTPAEPLAEPPPPVAPAKPELPPEPPLPTAAGVHYLEIVTGGAGPDDALPLIVAIHGLGDTPQGFRGLVADLPIKARVVLPRALDEHEPGWSWFPTRAADPDVETLSRGIETAANRIAAAVVSLSSDRPTVGKPIVTGFSQGGMLTFALAVQHPEAVGAAVAVGGWLPPPMWPKEKTKHGPAIDALHGTTDRAVAYEPTKAAVDHLAGLGYVATLHTYPDVGHQITPEMRAQLFELIVAAAKQATAADG